MARSPDRRDSDRFARDRRDDRTSRGNRGEVGGPPRDSRPRHLTTGQRRHDDLDRDRDRDRDRDNHRRRDRSYDGHDERRYDDRRVAGRRIRSRERSRDRDRKRSREASPVRDRPQERERYRDSRDVYDDRDRKRQRHGQSARQTTPPRGSRRDDAGGNRTPKSSSDRRNASPAATSARGNSNGQNATREDEAAKKAARLAKVAAMKQQMAQKSTDGAQSTLHGKGISQDRPQIQSPAPLGSDAAPSPSPVIGPGAGALKVKLDPKEITLKATAAMAKQKQKALGGDVAIPQSAIQASQRNAPPLANTALATAQSLEHANGKLHDANTKITGFGLTKTAPEKSDKHIARTAAGLDDEEATDERRLEKLPDLPSIDVTGDAALADDADEQGEGDDLHSDDEHDASAQEAAQKRAQEAQMAVQHDAAMKDAESTAGPTLQAARDADVPMDDDEDIDPLDAFMNTLDTPADEHDPLRDIRNGKKEPQVFNQDDGDGFVAVGDSTDDIAAIMTKKRKRDMPVVDHTKVQYQDFRKNFYSESVELADMTNEEVQLLRLELDNIKVHGVNPPKPIQNFPQGGFGAQMLDVIRQLKFEKPTAIQAQALPAIMSGRDTIGIAKTGSGKTMAFILPMFRHIKDQRPLESLDGPIGLILAPTRELAVQIHRDCKPFVKALNLRAVCAYGGSPIKDQIAELKRGAEIVVATPGRFIDLLAANSGRVTNLRRVTYIVLDEADRMFDMGFEPQITRVLNSVRPDRQTVLFSATFPRSMEALARKALTKPIEINVGGRSVVAAEIEQMVEVREQSTKFNRLLELLGMVHGKDEDARSLVFVEKQETADTLFKELQRRGYPCVSIHGGRDQIDRDQAISDLKAGNVPVMVATSVAARGLDVKQLKLVVNYDSPNHNEDYVHRCGRTGRAGNTGTAVTFVTPEQDRFAPFLVKAVQASGTEAPEELKKLAASFQERAAAGEAQKAGSGFGGRGIERLDAARKAERARERNQYKTGDEPEEEEDAPAKKPTAKDIEADKLVAAATGGVKARDAVPEPETGRDIIPSELAQHFRDAMKVQKATTPPPQSGPGNAPSKANPLDKVNAAVASINNRLGARGATRPGVPVDNRGPDAGAYHATLTINDFPQKARWAVTNRTNVAKILEATGTSITSKGNFYAKGKEPEPGGQPKLYILVEGDTEVVVENAMRELIRLLREGTTAAVDSEARAPAAGGRYSVI